ncbi:hypothetical protein M0R45_002844 [Rubus argutus]|uniref:DUF4283 domain-containing protein n=1 Tax=Rubus argutus TaxID=59490 RepID=A0AAW1VM52_RUBAR
MSSQVADGQKRARFEVAAQDIDDELNLVNKAKNQPPSFKDSLIGTTIFDPTTGGLDDISRITASDCKTQELARGPSIQFSEKVEEDLCKPWRNTIVLKPLGRPMAYSFLLDRLIPRWKVKGPWYLIDIPNDFFLVRFTLKEDMDFILTGGPLMIAGQYVAMQKWKPDFDATNHRVTHLAVWMRIVGLDIRYLNLILSLKLETSLVRRSKWIFTQHLRLEINCPDYITAESNLNPSDNGDKMIIENQQPIFGAQDSITTANLGKAESSTGQIGLGPWNDVVYKRTRKNLKGKPNSSGKSDTQGSRFQVLANETEETHITNGQSEAADIDSNVGKIWKPVPVKPTLRKKQSGTESAKQQEKTTSSPANPKIIDKGKSTVGPPILSTTPNHTGGCAASDTPANVTNRTVRKPARQRKPLKEITNGVVVKSFAIPITEDFLIKDLKKTTLPASQLIFPKAPDPGSSMQSSLPQKANDGELGDVKTREECHPNGK